MNVVKGNEGIQPLRGDCNMNQVQMGLPVQDNTHAQSAYVNEKQQFETLIQQYTGNDPLQHWYDYIAWADHKYARNGHRNEIMVLVQRCLALFEFDQRYFDDQRLCRLFVKFLDALPEPTKVYGMLYDRGLFKRLAFFYKAWAYYYEISGDFRRANEVLIKGSTEQAQPVSELIEAHAEMSSTIMARNEEKIRQRRRALIAIVGSDTVIHRPKGTLLCDGTAMTVISKANDPLLISPKRVPPRHVYRNNHTVTRNNEGASTKQHITEENMAECRGLDQLPSTTTGLQIPLHIMNNNVVQYVKPQGGLKLSHLFVSSSKETYAGWSVSLTLPDTSDLTKKCMYAKNIVYANENVEFSPEEVLAERYRNKCRISAYNSARVVESNRPMQYLPVTREKDCETAQISPFGIRPMHTNSTSQMINMHSPSNCLDAAIHTSAQNVRNDTPSTAMLNPVPANHKLDYYSIKGGHIANQIASTVTGQELPALSRPSQVRILPIQFPQVSPNVSSRDALMPSPQQLNAVSSTSTSFTRHHNLNSNHLTLVISDDEDEESHQSSTTPAQNPVLSQMLQQHRVIRNDQSTVIFSPTLSPASSNTQRSTSATGSSPCPTPTANSIIRPVNTNGSIQVKIVTPRKISLPPSQNSSSISSHHSIVIEDDDDEDADLRPTAKRTSAHQINKQPVICRSAMRSMPMNSVHNSSVPSVDDLAETGSRGGSQDPAVTPTADNSNRLSPQLVSFTAKRLERTPAPDVRNASNLVATPAPLSNNCNITPKRLSLCNTTQLSSSSSGDNSKTPNALQQTTTVLKNSSHTNASQTLQMPCLIPNNTTFRRRSSHKTSFQQRNDEMPVLSPANCFPTTTTTPSNIATTTPSIRLDQMSAEHNRNLEQNMKANEHLRRSLYSFMDMDTTPPASSVSKPTPATSPTPQCIVLDESVGKDAEQLNTSVAVAVQQPATKLHYVPSDPFRSSVIRDLLETVHFPGEHTDSYRWEGSLPKLAVRKETVIGGDRYYVEKQVGQGTFGQVYKATDEHKHMVALKFQKEPHKWEYYICKELQARLRKHHLRSCFMDIDIAYFSTHGSIFVSEFMAAGTLHQVVQAVRVKSGRAMKETLCMFFASEMLKVVQAMHNVHIIHADIKPDNFLVKLSPTASMDACVDQIGLQLIDFGSSIDMTLFPHENVAFTRKIQTEDFVCPEMLDGRPWNYHTDLFCVAASVHVLLFEKYIQLRKSPNGGQWSITHPMKRYMRVDVWNQFFSALLNQQNGPACPDTLILLLDEALDAKSDELLQDLRYLFNIILNR